MNHCHFSIFLNRNQTMLLTKKYLNHPNYKLDESHKTINIMLFQVLMNIVAVFLKFAIWVVLALVAVPYGVFIVLWKTFPTFTTDGSFWFWSVFSILTIIAYVILWKPLLWIVGTISALGAGN